MSGDEFQTRYLSVIDTMLTSAAAETTKLFETMVNELKEELTKIKKENEDLKSKCSYLELLTNQPKPDIHGIDSENGPGTSATCDVGVQCDLCCNEQGFRNSLPENMEQHKEDQKREDLQNQQFPLNIYGEGPLIKDGILEPALVHKKVPKDVQDSVTPQTVDHNKLLMAGNMFCPFERVEESELESPPGEEQSQKISQQVLRVDATMANEDNVTMQTSLNSEVISEHPIQLSEEVSFSMKGASCDSEIDLKEIGVDFQTKSSAQINKCKSPLKQRVKGKVPSPPVNLDIRNCPSINSAATSRRGQPPKKASLSELHTQPEPETSPIMGRPCRMPRCCVTKLPLQGTMSPPPSSDILPAINPQTSTLDAFEKSSSLPKMPVPAQTQNTSGFTSSNAPLTPSVSISHVSTQTTTTDNTSDPSTVVCQMSNSLPTLDQSTKRHSVPQLPLGPRNSDVSASAPSAVATCKTRSNSSTKLNQHVVIIPKSNRTLGATCTRAQSHLQHSSTSSPVEATNDSLGDSNIKNIYETRFASTQKMMQGKSSSLPDISECAEENAAYLKTKNMSFASEGPCVVNFGQKSLPTTLTKFQPSTVALTQSPLASIKELCSVSKTLPISSPSSSSSNKAFTKRCTVKALKQVAQEGTSAAPIPLFNDTVHLHSEITKRRFFAQLSMAPVVHRQEKESPNDSVDCVVAETATHNTTRQIRKGYMKPLKEAGPSHSVETTSKPTEVIPKVANLDTDEYSPDNARELAQKPDAASPKYKANKQIPCGLKGFRSITIKLSPSAKKHRLSQEKARPKESVDLVNNAFTLPIIKTVTVWTPPILAASKSPLGNDNCCDRIPTKRTTRSATPKRRTSSRLVQRKHRPPFTPSVSGSNDSPSAPRTIRYSHRGTTHPTAAKTSPVQSPSEPFSVNGECLLRNQCEQCGRVLCSKASLQRHGILHSRQKFFSCTLCSQSFPDSKALSRHGSVHRNGNVYICPQCNEGFAYRFGLTQHLQMVHHRIKPFVCHICRKSFFRRKDVETHLRVHTGPWQFPCNHCDKRFNGRVALAVHLRSHSRQKRHWCPYCGKEFLDYNNFKRHKYTHTGERRYSCPHCTKRFVQSGHLKKHLRNVHKVDVYADSQ